jgi:hypothetical protein
MTSETRRAGDELSRVADGTTGRDLAEIRQHLAFLEGQLPPFIQRAIAGEFGGLLRAEYGDPPRPVPDPPEGIPGGNTTQDPPA